MLRNATCELSVRPTILQKSGKQKWICTSVRLRACLWRWSQLQFASCGGEDILTGVHIAASSVGRIHCFLQDSNEVENSMQSERCLTKMEMPLMSFERYEDTTSYNDCLTSAVEAFVLSCISSCNVSLQLETWACWASPLSHILQPECHCHKSGFWTDSKHLLLFKILELCLAEHLFSLIAYHDRRAFLTSRKVQWVAALNLYWLMCF